MVWILPVLIIGMPAYGALFTPAMALLSRGAQHEGLDQGLAFGLGNLAWASGQAFAAAGGAALAQATSDLIPYCVLAAGCLLSLFLVRLYAPRKQQAEEAVAEGALGGEVGTISAHDEQPIGATAD